jgi:hypothetical protein
MKKQKGSHNKRDRQKIDVEQKEEEEGTEN